MKERLILFIVLSTFFACEQKKSSGPVVKSPNYLRAEALFETRPDSAFYYFNKVAGSSKDSLETAMAYNGMAELQYDAGDYFGSQENLTASLRYLDTRLPRHYRCLTADYNELGMTSLRLKNYDAAIGFYNQALKLTTDKQAKATLLNNQANAYQQKKDYKSAIELFRTALTLAGNDQRSYTRILTNLSYNQWLQQPIFNPVPGMLKALRIRLMTNDRWGQNGSYAHLTDYYLVKQPDSVASYAQKMYTIAKSLRSPDDQLEALIKLVKVSQPQEARRYFIRYEQLNDSVVTARSAAKNQFALIRYEVEKNKADNLKLQKDNTEKNMIIYSSIFLFIVITVMLSYRYQKRRQQAVQENQLQLATKVHNRLANGIYQLIQEIDNHEGYDKEMVAQELNILYERSRDISHEPAHLAEIDFAEKIDRLLTAFAGPAINVAIVGNETECWENINDAIKPELEQVLQEWMVNMKKHSEATNVSVQFSRTEDQLEITYTDNGIGLPAETANGKGLHFTENRIKMLGGSINFDTKWKKGARIYLALPLT